MLRYVFVVDDSSLHRQEVTRVLSSRGYAVRTAADGAEALSVLESDEPPAVVLLDMEMPVVTGREVLEHMDDSPRLRHIPVVILTASEAPATTSPDRLALCKPVAEADLLAIVDAFCKPYQAA